MASLNPSNNALKRTLLWLLPALVLLLIIAEFAAQALNENRSSLLFVRQASGAFDEFVTVADLEKQGLSTALTPDQRFNRQKSATAFRIFCIGGPVTRGLPYGPHIAYPAQLRNILTSLHPDREIEVVNCGTQDMHSEEMVAISEEILAKYQPDLLIVNVGHYEAAGPRQKNSPFQILSLLRDALSNENDPQTSAEHQTLLIPAPALSTTDAEQTSRILSENLTTIATAAAKSGVELLVCNSVMDNEADGEKYLEGLEAINAAIHHAVEASPAVLADIANEFAEVAADSALVNSLFHGRILPTYEGQYLIARQIARSMSDNGFITENWYWESAQSDSAYLAMTGITALDLEIAKYMTWRAFPETDEQGTAVPYAPISGGNTAKIAAEFVDSLQYDFSAPHIAAGSQAHRNNNFGKALAEYQAALNITPNCDTYNYIGAVYNQMAESAFRMAKNFQAASVHHSEGVKYYRAGLERCPDHLRLNYNLGLLQTMRNDRLDQARKYFERVLELEPTHANALGQLAKIHIREKDFELANKALHRAIDIHPEKAGYYSDLGIIAAQQRDYMRAEAWFQKAQTLNPKDQQTKYMLNQVRAMMKKIRHIQP